MTDNTYNLLKETITTVAKALGEEMLDEVAFVGGCTTGLLLTDEFSREAVRYTDDVDLIINVVGYPKWARFQERLLFPILNGSNFPDYFDWLSNFHFCLTIDLLGSAAADPSFSQMTGFSSTGSFASAHS